MTGQISTGFANLARAIVLVTLVAAPWPFGSYPLDWQPWVFGGVLAALCAWWLSVLTRPNVHSEGNTVLVDALLPPLLFVLLAAVQLVPLSPGELVPKHAALRNLIEPPSDADTSAGPVPTSVYPAATRLEAARILLALCAAFLGIQLYPDAGKRLWLYVPLAVNAAVLAGFGIWQKMHWIEWNEMLFGSVPLRFGGQPFASFVNRNNAAGYLNLGICAAAGWALLATAPRIGQGFRRVSDSQAASTGRTSSPPHRPTLTLQVIFSLLAIGVSAAGVIASLSRGGILGLVAAGVAAAWCLIQSSRSRLIVVGMLIILPTAVGASMYLGFAEQLRVRLETLTSGDVMHESRLTHWRETWGAVEDFPWLGGGLGAYRYIHRPYQTHSSAGTYVNADNQFFEWLVETGLVGMALILAFLAMVAMDVRRLASSRGPWEQRDAALMGAMLLGSQIVQSFTDFGIIVPANLIAAATLGGVIVGTRARSAPFDSVTISQGPLVFRTAPALLIGIIFLVGGGLAWWEVNLAATAFAARNDLSSLERHDFLDESELQYALARTTAAAERRPDDAELQQAIGDLWLYRNRHNATSVLSRVPRFAKTSQEDLWLFAPVERMVIVFDELSRQGRDTERNQLLEQINPDRSLEQGLDRYRRAVAACRWQPRSSERDAVLTLILQKDHSGARSLLHREALVSPSDPPSLLAIAALANLADDPDLCAACIHRSLQLDPSLLADALSVATVADRNTRWWSAALPQDGSLVLNAAERLTGTPVANDLANLAEELLRSEGILDRSPVQRERINNLKSNSRSDLDDLSSQPTFIPPD